jgi:hypothetical protein
MNVSIAILKVLSSYPDGRASYAALKSDLAMLSTRERLARMRILSARAGSINIFSEKFAMRDADGWTITKTGRDFLDRLERGEVRTEEVAAAELRVVASKAAPPSKPVQQVHLTLVRSA